MKKLFCLIFFSITLGLAGCRPDIDSGSDNQTQTPTPFRIPQIGVGFVTITPSAISQGNIQEPSAPATASPIPSPMPLIYLVKSGDTLFDIAAAHNTTTQEITELNPDLDPSLLLIGQEIVMPALSVTLVPTPMPTAESVEVELLGLNRVETPTGGIWILGEVHNQTGISVENVVVNLRFADESGQLVEERQAWITTSIINPGNRAPFGILIVPAPAGNISLQAEIVSADTVVDVGNRYTNFEVIDSEVTIGDSRVSVAGQIHNTGTSIANSISIIVTIYDGSGRVTGYTVKDLDEPMKPDERIPFVLDALPPGPDSVDVSLIVEGLMVAAED